MGKKCICNTKKGTLWGLISNVFIQDQKSVKVLYWRFWNIADCTENRCNIWNTDWLNSETFLFKKLWLLKFWIGGSFKTPQCVSMSYLHWNMNYFSPIFIYCIIYLQMFVLYMHEFPKKCWFWSCFLKSHQ